MTSESAAAVLVAALLCVAASPRPLPAAEIRDELGKLEAQPGPGATARLRRMLTESGDPYARLWLIDALYARVARHRDEDALEALAAASQDRDPAVRRRALNGLEAFDFLPEPSVRAGWLPRLRGIARRAGKDPAPAVRSAGAELERSLDRWTAGKRGLGASAGAADSAPPRPEEGDPGAPRGGRQRWLGMLLWAVGFQLAGYAWQKMGIALFKDSGAAGGEVRAGWEAFKARPGLFAYPALASAATILGLGAALARVLVGAAMPSDESWPGAGGAAAAAAAYAFCGLACFVPSAMLSADLAEDPGGRRGVPARAWAALRRAPGLLLLGLILLASWPREVLRRLTEAKPRSWLEREGAPLAGLLAAAVMARDGVAAREALRRAAGRYDSGAEDPSTAFLGRPLFRPQFVVLCLATPALFSVSAALPMWAVDFSPPRLFGLWFVSKGTFAVGFGLWSGALMSASMLALLWAFGAVHAAGRGIRNA